jgi:hypothetical protein
MIRSHKSRDIRPRHLVAASLLMMIGHSALAVDTTTVFGMELHKPLSVSECAYTRTGNKSGYYVQSPYNACYELISEGDSNAGRWSCPYQAGHAEG